MRVLVVGGGAREHALCASLAASPSVEEVWAAPGNPGIEAVATCWPVPISDLEGLASLVEGEGFDLTVVGPEAPLVAGLGDALRAAGHPVFGPSSDGARLEGSKAWAAELCERNAIPAARAETFDAVEPAVAFLDDLQPPFVVKADGLAAGKGVTIAADRAAARAALEASLEGGAFGEAGARVVIQEHLAGEEVSALALTDGRDVLPLPLAQDFKRALDGDRGPNTGGMGAFCPVRGLDERTAKAIEQDVLLAIVAALRAEGVDYRGVVYAGLMLTEDGPKVLEFNCRFGDPETQVILPRLRSDLGEALLACARGDLGGAGLAWDERACVGVVLASGGYPGPFSTGIPIEGLPDAGADAGLPGDVRVFHAGTERRSGRVVTAGGRVLTVTALGDGLAAARDRAYGAASRIRFDGMMLRHDVAERASAGGVR
jgi:phosphoribosylamine--glycine ligase